MTMDEGPSQADIEQFGGVTKTCPACGTEVYDQTSVCHECGEVFEGSSGGRPVWVVATAVVAIALILWIFVF